MSEEPSARVVPGSDNWEHFVMASGEPAPGPNGYV